MPKAKEKEGQSSISVKKQTRDGLRELCDRKRWSIGDITDALVVWFLELPEIVQSAVVGTTDAELRPVYARLLRELADRVEASAAAGTDRERLATHLLDFLETAKAKAKVSELRRRPGTVWKKDE